MLTLPKAWWPCQRHGDHGPWTMVTMETKISPEFPKIEKLFPSMPLAWSPSLCHNYHAIGMVTMLMAGSSCLGHGHYAFGRVSVPLVGSPRLWLGHHAFGRVITPLVWSPWLWDGFHTFGIVSMPALWSPRQRGPKRGVKESEILSKVSEGLSKVLRTCRRV